MQIKKLLFGACSLSLGAFISKILGAIYRIPLTNMLGGGGLGLYQMIFPVYSIILDFAGAGAPNAISRLIAKNGDLDREKNAVKILNVSVKLFSVLGLIGSLFLMAFSYLISKVQGNVNATLGYIFISPAIFLVAIIACYRGYFQGLMKMKPTAFSQVIEQVVKLILGLVLVGLFLPNVNLAVGGATLAVTVSELVALIYLLILYKRRKVKEKLNFILDKTPFKIDAINLIKSVLPITLIGIALPLSQFIDSFLIVNILSRYTERATSLYGLYSGAAHTVVSLPVSLLYGLGTASIPSISSVDWESEGKKKAFSVLGINMLFAIPISITLFLSSNVIVNILFKSLSVAERETVSSLIKIMSANVVLLSFTQTSNAVLIGKGKLYAPLCSLSIGVIIKSVLEIILLNNPNINIYACVIGSIACYFVVSLINLNLINGVGKKSESIKIKGEQLNT